MEDRLLKLLDSEQLSSARFADAIGVQRSSVSHILSGRNKPSFDFLQKTLKAFPLLNADWLILGEGNMYEDTTGPVAGSLFDQPHKERISDSEVAAHIQDKRGTDQAVSGAEEVPLTQKDDHSHNKPVSAGQKSGSGVSYRETANSDESIISRPTAGNDRAATPKQRPSNAIVRVIVFYNDKTFESFEIAD